jgi:hypothetical protein
MSDHQESSRGNGESTPQGYEPPAMTKLGSVAELTTGGRGVLRDTGNASAGGGDDE